MSGYEWLGVWAALALGGAVLFGVLFGSDFDDDNTEGDE